MNGGDDPVTIREFQRAVVTGAIMLVVFGCIIIVEVFGIARNSVTNKQLHIVECAINANLLQGISERREIESSTTFPSIEGPIRERRLKQLDDSAMRLNAVARQCAAMSDVPHADDLAVIR